MAVTPRCIIQNTGVRTHIYWRLHSHHCLANSRTFEDRTHFPGPVNFNKKIPGLSKRRGNPAWLYDWLFPVADLGVWNMSPALVSDSISWKHIYLNEAAASSEWVFVFRHYAQILLLTYSYRTVRSQCIPWSMWNYWLILIQICVLEAKITKNAPHHISKFATTGTLNDCT